MLNTRHPQKLSSMESNVKASSIPKIRVTDGDASDSSSRHKTEHRRMEKNNENKRMKCKSNAASIIRPNKQQKEQRLSNGVKYRGVRKRPCGKRAAEIRHPTDRKRIWLGTFNTAEEAALVYDKEATRIKGPNALTNFVKPHKIEVEMISGYNSSQESRSVSSPTYEDNSFELMKNDCDVPIKLSGEYSLTDPGAVAVCDYFEYDNPAPIFFEQMMLPDDSIFEQDCGDVSIKLDADFESSSWDVDNYY